MAVNSLLEEFTQLKEGDLRKRLTDLFDSHLTDSDEFASQKIREELEKILEDRLYASD